MKRRNFIRNSAVISGIASFPQAASGISNDFKMISIPRNYLEPK